MKNVLRYLPLFAAAALAPAVSAADNRVGERTAPFTLAGGGTKMIPVARPRIVSDGRRAFYIFRDEERGSRASVAATPELGSGVWKIDDVTPFSVGAWEPNIDINLWNNSKKLHVYIQPALQGDGELTAQASSPSSPVYVLEYDVDDI